MPEKRFVDLLEVLDRKRPVIIQTHDYPDHDAVASGFSLLRLLEEQGFSCSFCYGRDIHDFSVTSIIEDLGIPLKQASSLRFGGEEQIILVDGIAGNRNVTILSEAPIVGIIDHHQPPPQNTSPQEESCSAAYTARQGKTAYVPAGSCSSRRLPAVK